MSRASLAALALIASAAIAGCGSAKTASTTTASASASATTTTNTGSSTDAAISVASGKPLSTGRWLAKSQAICARLHTQLSASTALTQAELARLLPQASLYEQSALAQLANLVPPRAHVEDWQKLLTNLEHWASDSAQMGVEARSNNYKLNERLLSNTRNYEQAFARIAQQDGLVQCAAT